MWKSNRRRGMQRRSSPVEARVDRRGRSNPDWREASENGQRWGMVYEKGRGPTGIGPTNGDGGCKDWRVARANGRPYVKDGRCVAFSRRRWEGTVAGICMKRGWLSASAMLLEMVVRILVVPPCDATGEGLRLLQTLVAVPTCGVGICRKTTDVPLASQASSARNQQW
jgi:hypothetical protein